MKLYKIRNFTNMQDNLIQVKITGETFLFEKDMVFQFDKSTAVDGEIYHSLGVSFKFYSTEEGKFAECAVQKTMRIEYEFDKDEKHTSCSAGYIQLSTFNAITSAMKDNDYDWSHVVPGMRFNASIHKEGPVYDRILTLVKFKDAT